MVLLLIAASVTTAHSRSLPPPEEKLALKSKVTPNESIRNFDLVQSIFKDLDQSGKATESIEFRSITGNDGKKHFLQGDISVSLEDSRAFIHKNRKLAFVAIKVTNPQSDPWGENLLLAAFDLTSKIRLLDVVDVQEDRSCSLVNPQPHLANIQTMPFFLMTNSHANSDENFESYSLVAFTSGKFYAPCKDALFAYSCKTCDRELIEMPSIMVPSKRVGRPSNFVFRVTVTEVEKDCEHQFEKKRRSKNFDRTYLWQSNRYAPQSTSAAKKLCAEEARFGFNNN